MMLQLNPPLPLVTPMGKGLAHFIIDYGPEADLIWVVFLDHTAECWSFRNNVIRAQENATMGRQKPSLLAGWANDFWKK